MSYDIEIRSDDRYSRLVQFSHIISFITALPHITRSGATGFQYKVGDLSYMEIDLEFVDAEGDRIVQTDPDSINCIRAHIPYAYMQPGQNHPATYFTLCTTIARYLYWRAIDLQTDCDLLGEDNV